MPKAVKKEALLDEDKPMTPAPEEDRKPTAEELSWWANPEEMEKGARGTKKWESLVHNGPYFPPPYEPHGIPVKYEGKPVALSPHEEEVATYFAQLRNHEYYQQEAFRTNFFLCWRKVLDARPGGKDAHPIRKLALCDFDDIYAWYVADKEAKKSRTPVERAALKAEADEVEKTHKWAAVDGRTEPLTGFRVEPPGLFRGRGKHPLRGVLKKRIAPEDIIINVSDKREVPAPPPGHKWKQVVSIPTVMWVAMWRDSVTDGFKYIQFGTNSSFKGMSDRTKFERARKLAGYIERIRGDYTRDMVAKELATRQRAVAMYFIDKLALRCGNEKGEDEADTVGCCSLRVEHVIPRRLVTAGSQELGMRMVKRRVIGDDGQEIDVEEEQFGEDPTIDDAETPEQVLRAKQNLLLPRAEPTLHFDFLGKDSIRYHNDVVVTRQVYDLVSRFRESKRFDEMIFCQLTPGALNNHLHTYFTELSAKVFRTYNASKCLEEQLALGGSNMADPKYHVMKKLAFFNKCNTAVAVLCNHQKAVGKSFHTAMASLRQRVDAIDSAIAELQKNKGKKDADAAAKKFYQEQDAAQFAWIEDHGKPDDKEKYVKYVEKRGFGVSRAKGGSQKKSSGGKKDSSRKSTKSKKSSSRKSAGKKTSKKKIKGEDDDETSDDEPLISKALSKKAAKSTKKAAPKKGAKKAAPKKKPAAKKSKKK